MAIVAALNLRWWVWGWVCERHVSIGVTRATRRPNDTAPHVRGRRVVYGCDGAGRASALRRSAG